MKKTVSLLLTLLLCGAVSAQQARSLSVWSGGASSEYAVYETDSMAFRGDGSMLLFTLEGRDTLNTALVDSVTFSYPELKSTNTRTNEEIKADFDALTITSGAKAYKSVSRTAEYHNPLMGHKFGADPFGMVVGDRMYIYMTDDHLYRSTDGQPITGAFDYSDCKNVNIISSDDLVNWTDHGTQPVAGSYGPASWATQMWAPCAAHKTIRGQEQFFLYFSNSNNGIGVLVADSPYGPWKQPSNLSGPLISRSSPNCGDVPSIYDPAVLMDDDGKAYIYFGGGFNDDNPSDPGSARCVKLGTNMTSISGTPVQIKPPYMFEDSGINKVGGKYLYSYCSNFKAGGNAPGSGNIGYMVSDNPLGPYTFMGNCFDNPGGASWAGGGGNNHHAIIEFQGKYYILYHTRTLKSAMRSSNPDINDNVELRSTCLSEIKVDEKNARIEQLTNSGITQKGVSQIRNFDPYREVPGATMAWEWNVTTEFTKGTTPKNTYCSAHLREGSWMALSDVDFKRGAVGFSATVSGKGSIKICSTNPGRAGAVYVLADVDSKTYSTITVPVVQKPEGVMHLMFIVTTGDVRIKSWNFF